ncbi:GNAT family N-acetyltransferase [Neobacillus sp. NRS-1170]|uniref:GNAT family N-acetyltransferase n=1 Tax=Neobacillus sp. NRS-1170 TaxID=3233898 RepID=UPI003D2CF0E1
MKLTLNELDKDDLVHITQDNMIELMRYWSECTDQFQVVEDQQSFRVKSYLPHPLFNNILKTAINHDETESVRQIVKEYKDQKVPFLWRIWDHDTPVNIGEILLENGGQPIPNTTLMAIDLGSFHPLTEPYPGLTIQRVKNKQDGLNFSKCASSAFGIPSDLTNVMAELIAKQDHNTSHYVGFINGTAISTSSIFYNNDVAGIYNVGTLLDYQGKGIGVEIMTTILLKAKLDGYKTAILHATPAGKRLYEKLGFNTYGEMRQYIFV